MKTFFSFFLLFCGLKSILFSQSPLFLKTVITRDFLSEGVAVADLNKDGEKDIIAGYTEFLVPWDTWVLRATTNSDNDLISSDSLD
jgi:hypothetical protein